VASPRDRTANRSAAADGVTRDQEVVRARKELAAYFKGLRTEREARAALKIIKAFVREREKIEVAKRRPLPGLRPAGITRRKAHRRTARRAPRAVVTTAEDPSTTD
jgi:hypothetical protein